MSKRRMAREPNIPLFLWVAAAIVAHLTWGGGADRVAAVLEEQADVRRFAASVQRQLRGRFAVEVALLDESELEDLDRALSDRPEVVDGAPDDESARERPEQVDKQVDDRPDTAQPAKVPPPKPKPVPPEVKKPPAKEKADKPKPEVKEPDEKKDTPKPPVAPLQIPRRVAVIQHVEDDKQKESAEAEFLADHNNTVREQTQARVTATDQDNEKPTPGSHHTGPSDLPGDSHVTDIAQADDAPGELNRAPSEDKLAAVKQSVSVAQPQGVPEVAGRVRKGPDEADPGERGQTAEAASRAQAAMPETYADGSGAWSVADQRQALAERMAQSARRYREARARGSKRGAMDFLGLGAEGRTERGVNLNLTPGTALAAIGQDQLAREIRADGERRRSKHRGSWKKVGIERWRPAIENYVATVRLGNQTALNTAARPFASYLNRIHNRLHPIFAVNYLGFLNDMPGSAGLNDRNMKTDLEIVLSQSNGSVVKMGVTRTSGVTAFDISALESVDRAAPFGRPPESIVSPDGNVYLHWEFHRDPLYACSTYYARPYIIKVPQKSAPPSVPPAGPFTPEERLPTKQGFLHRQRPVPGQPAQTPRDARLSSTAGP